MRGGVRAAVVLLLAIAAGAAARGEEGAPRSAPDSASFPLDTILRRNDARHGTLGPTGKRLLMDHLEEAPGFLGFPSYFGGSFDFHDPVRLEFQGESGPLVLTVRRTTWRPSHLEVEWSARDEGAAADAPGGTRLRVVERKFLTDDDAFVDVVRIENTGDEPSDVEVLASGRMTPSPDRSRSRQIAFDLSGVANLAPCPGKRILFRGELWPPFEWSEAEDGFVGSIRNFKREYAEGASRRGALGGGFGAHEGDAATYIAVVPDCGEAGVDLVLRYRRTEPGEARFRVAQDGSEIGTVALPSTGVSGAGGEEAPAWGLARLSGAALRPGFCRLTFVAANDGSDVILDGFYLLPAGMEPPPLSPEGSFPRGSDQYVLLPGTFEDDGVGFLFPDPSDPNRPTVVALRGGRPGDPAQELPDSVRLVPPDVGSSIATFHLLALYEFLRGFEDGSPAHFTFVLDDGSEEGIPFPGYGEGNSSKDYVEGKVLPGLVKGAARDRAGWSFLKVPRVARPCVRLSYVPPPGRFVREVVFAKTGEARPEVMVLLAATVEIPPATGRPPALVGRPRRAALPLALALAGSEVAPVTNAEGERRLLRAIALPPGEAREFRVALAVRPDRVTDASRAAQAHADDEEVFEKHVATYRAWFDENVPLFDCSDPLLEQVWHYRWFLARRRMLRPEIPPLTAPIFYGEHQRVTTRMTPHVLAEMRWLRDPIYAVGQLRAHLRAPLPGGILGDVSLEGTVPGAKHWIPAAALGLYRVHPSEQYLEEVVGLLARSFEEEVRAMSPPAPDAFLFASASAVAEGYELLGDADGARRFREIAELVRPAEPVALGEVGFELECAGVSREEIPTGDEEALRALARLHLEDGDLARPFFREPVDPAARNKYRSPDAFVCAFNDLVVRYVGGIVPAPDDPLDLEPRVLTLDHFRFRRLRYHGCDLEISWVRPGTANPYASEGVPEGYRVVVDGVEATLRPRLEAVRGIPLARGARGARSEEGKR